MHNTNTKKIFQLIYIYAAKTKKYNWHKTSRDSCQVASSGAGVSKNLTLYVLTFDEAYVMESTVAPFINMV